MSDAVFNDKLRIFRITVAQSTTVQAENEEYAGLVAAMTLGLDELPVDAQVTEVFS